MGALAFPRTPVRNDKISKVTTEEMTEKEVSWVGGGQRGIAQSGECGKGF